MATYLQGVTDYIPDYQPFQPDLNFYGNLLQTKQSQYDTNWQSLNNLYGQLYGADLTHDKNIEKKDELLKHIDFNLKRVSGLDLSLEQNVTQATQVFKPFYEDRYLMKDMAWTKNWKNTYGSANALKNSQDPKQRKQWWGIGIQGLELRRQMFKDATLDETLNMGNATYTPLVNVNQEYMDLAKKYDIGAVQTVPDQSGLYLIKKKNGELILPTLQNTFLAEYANRPDIQDMYREKAFVERMNYANQNAEKFGGNKLEAEKEYIKDKYDWLKSYASDKNVKAQDELKTTKQLQGNLQKEINQGNVNPLQSSYADRLNDALKINGAVADDAEKLNNQINDKQATTTVQGYDEDILSDIELARLKVDAGFASVAAEQDIMTAANNYATLNMEVEYKPNPVGLEFLRDKHARERQSQSHQDRQSEIAMQTEAKSKQKAIDWLVENRYYSYDQNAKLNTNPQAQGFGITLTTPDGTTSGEEMSIDASNKFMRDEMISQHATEPVNNLMKYINNGVVGESFTAANLAQIVLKFNPSDPLAKKIMKEGSKNYKPEIVKVWNNIWASYKANPSAFTNKNVNSGQIYNVNELMQSWTSQHSGSELAKEYFNDPSMLQLNQLARTDDALNVVRNNNYDKIRTKFTQDLTYIVDKVKSKDPALYDKVDSKINKAVDLMMTRYALDAHGNLDEFKEMAPEMDQQISSVLGFSIGKTTNQKAEAKWYNYVFPLTNVPRILGDGRENVKDKASWVADVFDNSFEELAKDMNPKTGLQTYAVTGSNRSGNTVAFAADTGNMMVAPGVVFDPGNQAASQMFNTILSTNWNQDRNKFRITTGGNQLPGSEETWGDTGVTQNEATAIIREMQTRLNSDKTMKPFMVGATRMSMESNSLGSMKLMAPREVIEQVIKSMEGEGATEAALKTKIDAIYQKGITFIAPKNVWESNKLFSNQFPTPTEILLRQGPIKYENPNKNGKYYIEQTPGTSDYVGVAEYYEMKPDGSKKTHYKYLDNDVRSGRTIEEKEQGMNSLISQVSVINFNMFKRIHESGNQEAIQKAVSNFGITTTNPFWQYNK